MVVTGSCNSAEDGVYTKVGVTANGRQIWHNTNGRWIYHDPDCNGFGMVARWIIDDSMPSTSRSSDLDEDGACTYSGRIESDASEIPTGTQTWRMYCGSESGWGDVALTITYQLADVYKVGL